MLLVCGHIVMCIFCSEFGKLVGQYIYTLLIVQNVGKNLSLSEITTQAVYI